MNLTQLKYFKAVSVYGSVSAAAEFLFISQPSLSAAIKDLEDEFGVPLFYRHHNGMTLTDEGSELLKLSDDLLLRAEEVERRMKDVGHKRKIIRLGVPPMLGSLILPKIFKEFGEIDPTVEFEIFEEGSQKLTELLDGDRLDLTFVTHERPISSSYKTIPVSDFEIVCGVKKGCELSKMKIVSPEDLAEKQIVLFKNSFFQTEAIKKWFSDSGVKPNILFQTDQVSTLNNIILSDIAIGFMFKQLVSKTSGLSAIQLENPINAKVSLVWRTKSGAFNSMKNFIQYIKTSEF